MEINSNVDMIWNKFLSLIKKRVSSLAYDTWFKDTRLYELSSEAIIIVTTTTHKKHLAESYNDIITEILNEITGTNFNLKFLLENEIIKNEVEEVKEEKIEEPQGVPFNSAKKANLNPDYKFENFIVGESNRFAQATALAVAENPGKMYNPLFIYGNSGLGKTHLMHAIGNYIVENSNKKVIYVSSETFISDFLELNKRFNNGNNYDKVDNFKDKYRNLDVLIIDDIQFLGNAQKSQEEFFHTFNTLFDNKKQIIISSDSSPDDLKNLEDRLRTRFNWGLKVNIFPPDNELRKKILMNKINNTIFANSIDDDVIDYIANTCQSDVRNLEGSLTRVCAYATIFGVDKINLDLAMEALKGSMPKSINNGINSQSGLYDISRIQRAVADYYHVTVEDLKGKKRVANIAFPRHIAIYLCRNLTDASFPRIGMEFGARDHSTVMSSCERIDKELKINKQLEKVIEEIKKKLE